MDKKPESFAELERMAANGQTPLPDALTLPRQMAFLCLRALVQAYRMKLVTKEQASVEKDRILKAYMDAELDMKISHDTALMRNRLSSYMTEIEKGGCEKCKLAVRIFDGREQTQ